MSIPRLLKMLRRSLWLPWLLGPAVAAASAAVAIDFLSILRWRLYLRLRTEHCRCARLAPEGLWSWVSWLLEALAAWVPQWLVPTRPPQAEPFAGPWFCACCAHFLGPQLRRLGPLPCLYARYIAACRPDLALSGAMLPLVRTWRSGDQEFEGAIGRKVLSSSEESLRHAESRLSVALGPRWWRVLQIDPCPIGADVVSEAYRAIFRETAAFEAREVPFTGRRTWSMSSFPCRRRRDDLLCGTSGRRATVAEAVEARGAILRVRRPQVAALALTDLAILGAALRVLKYARLIPPGVAECYEDFAAFAKRQLDFRYEASMLQRARAASPQGCGVTFPRLMGQATAELFIVSYEEGLSLAEAIQRPQSRQTDEDEEAAWQLAATRLATTFCSAMLDRGIAIGGLSHNILLLRAATSTLDGGTGCLALDFDDDEELQEVVVLRCNLAHVVDARARSDLNQFAYILANGSPEAMGAFFLDRCRLQHGTVRAPGSFAAGAVELASAVRSDPHGGGSTPLWGAALLQVALSLCKAHGVHMGAAHLRAAAATAAMHGVCARIDPRGAGGLFEALRAAAGAPGE